MIHEDGLQPYPAWRPNWSAELNIDTSRSESRLTNWDAGRVEYTPAGRCRIVIEGTLERVEPYALAIHKLLHGEEE